MLNPIAMNHPRFALLVFGRKSLVPTHYDRPGILGRLWRGVKPRSQPDCPGLALGHYQSKEQLLTEAVQLLHQRGRSANRTPTAFHSKAQGRPELACTELVEASKGAPWVMIKR